MGQVCQTLGLLFRRSLKRCKFYTRRRSIHRDRSRDQQRSSIRSRRTTCVARLSGTCLMQALISRWLSSSQGTPAWVRRRDTIVGLKRGRGRRRSAFTFRGGEPDSMQPRVASSHRGFRVASRMKPACFRRASGVAEPLTYRAATLF